jgi:hypothetical protein
MVKEQSRRKVQASAEQQSSLVREDMSGYSRNASSAGVNELMKVPNLV